MDSLETRILNIIQTDFPISNRPYQTLAEMLEISEDEALACVRQLAESGVIRKIGASFDTSRLGHVSTLAAAKVPRERLDEVAEIVNSFPQVTHNYGRDFDYNLWFALVCTGQDEIDRVIHEIKRRSGIEDIHLLPAERLFKIKVNFKF